MPKRKRAIDTIRYGIEIECEFPEKEDSEKLVEKNRLIRGWWLDNDWSTDNGAEYKPKNSNKLFFNKDGFDQIKEVLGLSKAHKARISQRCGLHVHVDMKGFSNQEIANIVSAYLKNQDQIHKDFKVLKYRLRKHCRKIPRSVKKFLTEEAFKRLRQNKDLGNYLNHDYFSDRHWALNVDSLNEHGTLEFRLFNGSIQINTIKRNVRFALQFCLDNAKGA